MPPSCLSAADKNWCGNFAYIRSARYPRTKITGVATPAQAFACHAFVDRDLLLNQSRRGREPRHATLRFAGPFDLPLAFRVPSLLLDCLFELGTAVEDISVFVQPLDFGLIYLTSRAEAESARRDGDHGETFAEQLVKRCPRNFRAAAIVLSEHHGQVESVVALGILLAESIRQIVFHEVNPLAGNVCFHASALGRQIRQWLRVVHARPQIGQARRRILDRPRPDAPDCRLEALQARA